MSPRTPSTSSHREEAVTDEPREPTTVNTFTRYSFLPSPTNSSTTATTFEPSSKANEILLYTIRLPDYATAQEYQILADEFVRDGAVIYRVGVCGAFGALRVWLSRRLLEELKNGKLEYGHRITDFYPAVVMSKEEAEEGEEGEDDLKDGSEADVEVLWD